MCDLSLEIVIKWRNDNVYWEHVKILVYNKLVIKKIARFLKYVF